MKDVVLTIAGSDSSGGAGIQADLKTFTALGCYGASVITALTAQNTTGVQGVHSCPAEFVASQISSVFDDMNVGAVKTGMLSNSGIIRTVSKKLQKQDESIPLVVDPVCVSTSGHDLLEPDALEDFKTYIIPLATLLTPNIPEVWKLLGDGARIESISDMLDAAIRLAYLGTADEGVDRPKSPRAILVKGGHLTVSHEDLKNFHKTHPVVDVIYQALPPPDILIVAYTSPDRRSVGRVVDVLYEPSNQRSTLLVRPRIDTTSTHGTGCTLSAAIASGLARRQTLLPAVYAATLYTHAAISHAKPLGKGSCGPLNHMWKRAHSNVIAHRTDVHRFPFTIHLIQETRKEWNSYVDHAFVKQVMDGTLPKACFVRFIVQDYLYLRYFARAHGLLAAKLGSFKEIEEVSEIMLHISRESSSHAKLCAQWGVSIQELESAPESARTTAYGAHLLDVGLQGDVKRVKVALAACLLGYGEVGLRLGNWTSSQHDAWKERAHPYRAWIDGYAGEEYQNAVARGMEELERLVDGEGDRRVRAWTEEWRRSVMLEREFWDDAMEAIAKPE